VSVEAVVERLIRPLDDDDVARWRSRWWERAACRGEDPELFFPTRCEVEKVQAAKAVCARCPVRAECLEYALAVNEQNGIWGGLSGKQRRAERRRRQRAVGT
jgi:WhiB family transcriptional regulator, redox-sensing transcriptional regulator